MERDCVDQYDDEFASKEKFVLVWPALLFLHRPIIELIESIFS